MPIVPKTDSKRKCYYGYERPKSDVLYDAFHKIDMAFHEYTKKCRLEDDAECDDDKLYRVVERVDQRLEYYRIYHENMHLSEVRAMGVAAFWILKYRPFQITVKGVHTYPNEGMALHIILSMISVIQKQKLSIDPDFTRRIIHAFKEHDLTMISMMLIADSLLQDVI